MTWIRLGSNTPCGLGVSSAAMAVSVPPDGGQQQEHQGHGDDDDPRPFGEFGGEDDDRQHLGGDRPIARTVRETRIRRIASRLSLSRIRVSKC
jgi:hypothetical protein